MVPPCVLPGRDRGSHRWEGGADPMVMPLAGRVVAAVIGGLLVLTSAASLIGTLVVTRSVGSRLTWWVDRTVDRAYQLVVSRAADSRRRALERRNGHQDATVIAAAAGTWPA